MQSWGTRGHSAALARIIRQSWGTRYKPSYNQESWHNRL